MFCGAGTSAYVADTVVPYLRSHGDTNAFEFAAVATTDIVCAPLDYVNPDGPTVMVSFARSGNSPESMAAYERVGQVAKDLLYLNVTCAPEGKLAQESQGDPRALTLLIPRANDKGFAMTGSYSCMLLLSALIFDESPLSNKRAWVAAAAELGRNVVAREDEIAAWLEPEYNRVTYLGSASLSGLAREAQLKILELCAGKVATSFDSSMGYRHGPKSFVDGHTLVFDFVSNDPYTRSYPPLYVAGSPGELTTLPHCSHGCKAKSARSYPSGAFYGRILGVYFALSASLAASGVYRQGGRLYERRTWYGYHCKF